MNKKFSIGVIFVIMIFMTSCQPIQKAFEETFDTQPQKLNKNNVEDKKILEKVKDSLFDETNERVNVLDIVTDAEDKMGFEFPNELSSDFRFYLLSNDIARYLSKEEIIEILESFKEDNLLLNNDKLQSLREELITRVGTEDFYIYKSNIMVNYGGLYVYVIDPDNPEHVDLYYYNLSSDAWHIIPEKLKADINPMERAILFSKINFENYAKMVDIGIKTLKEIGDYNEYYLMNSNLGMSSIYTQYMGSDLVFKARVIGTREDYDLTFDLNGNLIEKERI